MNTLKELAFDERTMAPVGDPAARLKSKPEDCRSKIRVDQMAADCAQKFCASLGKLGERGMLRRLLPGLAARPDVCVGAGDDCAVVRADKEARFDLLLTSDPVIEGIHFSSSAPAPAIGHKAIARVFSDVAAMGGTPLWVLADIVAPCTTRASRIAGIYKGLNRLASRHGAAVVGGDISAGPTLELHVFCVGRAPKGRAVLRKGARPGDALYVTGALGGSGRGRHLVFEPRLKEGQWLLAGGWATAAMDISDGLAMDLPRLLEQSQCGAEIHLADLPIHADALRMSNGKSPLKRALCDGEDFELLFTVASSRCAAFETAWHKHFKAPCARIGRILARSRGLKSVDAAGRKHNFEHGGYEHFHA